jgi:lysozyme
MTSQAPAPAPASNNTALFLVLGGAVAAYGYFRFSSAASAAIAPPPPSEDMGPGGSPGSSPPPVDPVTGGGGGPQASPDLAPYPYPYPPSYPPLPLTYAPPSMYMPAPSSRPIASISKPWRISASERAAIQAGEGLRLTRYKDGTGYSIGYGHQITPTDNIGQTITQAQAQSLFNRDIAGVESTLNSSVRVPLNQNEIDALGDFVFNIGAPRFKSSTLLRLLNAGNYMGAAGELARWHYSSGSSSPGLVQRRAQEAALFERGLVNVA